MGLAGHTNMMVTSRPVARGGSGGSIEPPF